MRFIVPFGRDGAADRAARLFAVGPDVAFENLPGEGGLRGVRRANELAGAGEPVLLLGTPTTHVLLPVRLGDHAAPHESLRPIAGLGSAPNVLLVSPRLEVRSVQDLVSRARQSTLAYASAGVGQTIHVCTALFCAQAGVRMAHCPYDAGSASAYADLIAGNVHVYFDSLLGCRDRIARGDAVPLAVSAHGRSALLPQVPTLTECGFPGHALPVWLGIFGSAAPEGIAGDAAGEEVAKGLGALGLSGGPLPAQALAAEVRASAPRWRAALQVALAQP